MMSSTYRLPPYPPAGLRSIVDLSCKNPTSIAVRHYGMLLGTGLRFKTQFALRSAKKVSVPTSGPTVVYIVSSLIMSAPTCPSYLSFGSFVLRYNTVSVITKCAFSFGNFWLIVLLPWLPSPGCRWLGCLVCQYSWRYFFNSWYWLPTLDKCYYIGERRRI